jgi:hypothetical protein
MPLEGRYKCWQANWKWRSTKTDWRTSSSWSFWWGEPPVAMKASKCSGWWIPSRSTCGAVTIPTISCWRSWTNSKLR